MKQLHSMKEAQAYLYSGMPATKHNAFQGQPGLQRALDFFQSLNNLQDSFTSIHITGTSGKGSIAYLLSYLLKAHGFTVGTYTSPHFFDIRERVLINGTLIDEELFLEILNSLLPNIESSKHSEFGAVSFFETMNAIAFTAFKQQDVDYAVLETGLGGLYDSTNSISRADKVSIIGKLGHDHTEILGNTLEQIAFQKAGIINNNSFAIALEPTDHTAKMSIARTARERHATLQFLDPQLVIDNTTINSRGSSFDYCGDKLKIKGIKLGIYGLHQVENAILALTALEYLSQRDKFTLNPHAITTALTSIVIPGRFERKQWRGKELILDGAHNPQKTTALADALKTYTSKKVGLLVAFKEDKDIAAIAKILAPYTHTAVISTYHNNPDDKLHTPAKPEEVRRIFEQAGITTILAPDSPKTALEQIIKHCPQDSPIVITGSIYFEGEIGNYINKSAGNE